MHVANKFTKGHIIVFVLQCCCEIKLLNGVFATVCYKIIVYPNQPYRSIIPGHFWVPFCMECIILLISFLLLRLKVKEVFITLY